MLIIQNGYECEYELKLFSGMFFDRDEDGYIFSNFEYGNGEINVYTEIIYGFDTYFEDYRFAFDTENKSERLIKKVFTAACTKSFVHAARKIKNINLPWGVMCGIRPAKNMRLLLEEGMSSAEAENVFKTVYEVSDEKTALARKVAENESRLIKDISPDSVSLYIGIPFCPTRCLYCSFVSTDIHTSGKYMDEFVGKLMLEIDKTAQIIRKLGKFAENIYIGGGTPTTLTFQQLDRLCAKIAECFDLSALREYTVEAGRPDTITVDKLHTLRAHGVDRISVNPQTMSDKVLNVIGRRHTAADIVEALEMVCKVGGMAVNMDLIAGLPADSAGGFEKTLDTVIALNPENITVHTLSLKKGSRITLEGSAIPSDAEVGKMLDLAQDRLRSGGWAPYYLYRQKFMSGGFENVGWTKPGSENIYNVCIMEELCSIIALGGGGSTKLISPAGGRNIRFFAPKYPAEYISGIQKTCSDKQGIIDFYSKESKK